MVDSLDSHLEAGLPKGKKAMVFLKQAYDCGPQGLVNRALTDKLLAKSGLSFHVGTDDPSMRRIASWLLTYHNERIPELIGKMWKRRGREDVKLLGLLIANQEGDAWAELMSIIDSPLPVDVMLDLVEEIRRSGRSIPSLESLQRMVVDDLRHRLAMLIASLDMNEDLVELVTTAPIGGELYERIRRRCLDA